MIRPHARPQVAVRGDHRDKASPQQTWHMQLGRGSLAIACAHLRGSAREARVRPHGGCVLTSWPHPPRLLALHADPAVRGDVVRGARSRKTFGAAKGGGPGLGRGARHRHRRLTPAEARRPARMHPSSPRKPPRERLEIARGLHGRARLDRSLPFGSLASEECHGGAGGGGKTVLGRYRREAGAAALSFGRGEVGESETESSGGADAERTSPTSVYTPSPDCG